MPHSLPIKIMCTQWEAIDAATWILETDHMRVRTLLS